MAPLLICNIFMHPTFIHIRNHSETFDLDAVCPPFQNGASHQIKPVQLEYKFTVSNQLSLVELWPSFTSTVGIQILYPSVGPRFCGMPVPGSPRQLFRVWLSSIYSKAEQPWYVCHMHRQRKVNTQMFNLLQAFKVGLVVLISVEIKYLPSVRKTDFFHLPGIYGAWPQQ